MTCRTYTKKETVFHAAYIVFLSVSGVMASYSAVFALFNISCLEDFGRLYDILFIADSFR